MPMPTLKVRLAQLDANSPATRPAWWRERWDDRTSIEALFSAFCAGYPSLGGCFALNAIRKLIRLTCCQAGDDYVDCCLSIKSYFRDWGSHGNGGYRTSVSVATNLSQMGELFLLPWEDRGALRAIVDFQGNWEVEITCNRFIIAGVLALLMGWGFSPDPESSEPQLLSLRDEAAQRESWAQLTSAEGAAVQRTSPEGFPEGTETTRASDPPSDA